MKHQLLICRFSARLSNYMSKSLSVAGLPQPQDSMSLLALLEQEFIDLSAKLRSQLTGKSPRKPSGNLPTQT